MSEKQLWIVEVAEEIQSIPLEECEEPDGEVEEGDHIVGEMSDGLRRMYAYMSRLGDQLKNEAEELKLPERRPTTFADLKDAVRKASDMVNRYRLISEMFWECVKKEFPELRSKRCIGVRNDFKVVWSEEKAEPRVHLIFGPGVEEALVEMAAAMNATERSGVS